MKLTKDARKLSKRLFQASFLNGALDSAKVSKVLEAVLGSKPRHYLAVLKNYQRLVRMEVEKRLAIVESAVSLDASMKDKLSSQLKARHGSDLSIEFRANPALLGGLRIKIGSDVWDGSVRSRLGALKETMAR